MTCARVMRRGGKDSPGAGCQRGDRRNRYTSGLISLGRPQGGELATVSCSRCCCCSGLVVCVCVCVCVCVYVCVCSVELRVGFCPLKDTQLHPSTLGAGTCSTDQVENRPLALGSLTAEMVQQAVSVLTQAASWRQKGAYG